MTCNVCVTTEETRLTAVSCAYRIIAVETYRTVTVVIGPLDRTSGLASCVADHTFTTPRVNRESNHPSRAPCFFVVSGAAAAPRRLILVIASQPFWGGIQILVKEEPTCNNENTPAASTGSESPC